MGKWIKCSDQLPTVEGTYLCVYECGAYHVLNYADGWNCHREFGTGEIYRKHEIKVVVAWQEIEPYKEDAAEHKCAGCMGASFNDCEDCKGTCQKCGEHANG